MTSKTLLIGDRIEYEGHRGTIKYIGPVPKKGDNQDLTSSISCCNFSSSLTNEVEDNPFFLGIEWDDPTRGKHNGTFKNQVYFTTKHPTSGSFLKSTLPKISYGIGFLHALKEKYLMPEDQVKDTVISFGGNEKIAVKTVGWNKVYQKQKRLSQLKEVGLSGRCIKFLEARMEVAPQDELDQAQEQQEQLKDQKENKSCSQMVDTDLFQVCPSITDLDLSRNLISSWYVVAAIAFGLSQLTSLRLNDTRFEFPLGFSSSSCCFIGHGENTNLSNTITHKRNSHLTRAFQNVTHLSLSLTKMTWDQLLSIEPSFPELQELNFGFNDLEEITPFDAKNHFQNLKFLNLEHNRLKKWDQINHLKNLPSLEGLLLNHNQLESIHYLKDEGLLTTTITIPTITTPTTSTSTTNTNFILLKAVNLIGNNIQDWGSVHQLNFFPNLIDIRFKENPVLKDIEEKKRHYFLIGRLGKIKLLNKSIVKDRHRLDAELFYLTFIHQNQQQGQLDIHPRFSTLSEKYKEFVLTKQATHTIKEGLIYMKIQYKEQVLERKLLCKMSVRGLKSMMIKLFKIKNSRISIQVQTADGREFLLNDDGKEIQFYSVGQGDLLVIE